MSSYDKCDAHLAAALCSNFAGYEFTDGLVSLLIEIRDEHVPKAISEFKKLCEAHHALSVKAHTDTSSRFLTATGSLDWLKALQQEDWVARLALANQLRPARPERSRIEPKRSIELATPKSKGSVLLGVIDHGCPFAHAQLLDKDGRTRVLSIWDQDVASEFKPALSFVPAQFGYGAQINQQQLNNLISLRINGEDESQAYEALGYDSLHHQLTHGAHTLSLFAGVKLTRSVLEKTYGAAPELNRLGVGKHCESSDIVFVQLPRRALLSPAATGMSRCILDGARYILSHASDETQRVVICIPYGSLLGPHDGTSLIEQALDAVVQDARKKNIDAKLVFSSGNAADKSVYAHTSQTFNLASGIKTIESQLLWVVPPHLQANATLDIWLKYPSQETKMEVIEPGGGKHVVTLSKSIENTAVSIKQHGNQVGVLTIVNDAINNQLNMLLQLSAGIFANSAQVISGRWKIQWQTITAEPLDAHFYLGWGGRNNGFGQRIFRSRLIAGSTDIVIPKQGSILGTACGHETYVVGGCSSAPSYTRAAYSGGGKPRGGSKKQVSCLSVSEESHALPGLACSGVRSSFNARVNGTSVSAPLAARMLADSGWLITPAKTDRKSPDVSAAQQSGEVAQETPIDVHRL